MAVSFLHFLAGIKCQNEFRIITELELPHLYIIAQMKQILLPLLDLLNWKYRSSFVS